MKAFDKVSIRNKLILSSLIFILPIGMLLYYAVSGINYDIRFAQLEAYGNAYQRPLMRAFAALPPYTLALMQGDQEAAATEADDIDNGLANLKPIDSKYGPELQFTAQGLEQRGRTNLAYGNVLRVWQSVKSGATGQGREEAAQNFLDLLSGVIAHAGDTSNLILDPDLDSYYLMDVTLLGIPQFIQHLNELAITGLQSQEENDSKSLQLAVLARLIEDDVSRIAASISTALNEDDNFYGRYEKMHQTIPRALAGLQSASKALIDSVGKLSAGAGDTTFPEHLIQSSQAILKLWDVCAGELDALLEIRMDSYRGDRLHILISTILVALFALFVIFMSARSILSSLNHLVLYAEKVAKGDLSALPEGTYSVSLNRLKHSVQSMVESLKTQMGAAKESNQEALTSKTEAESALVEADKQKALAEKQAGRLSKLGAQINAMAENLATATQQLSTTTEEQADGAAQQRVRADQVATAMEQMTQTVLDVASNASSTSEAARSATESSRGGVELVRQAMESIEEVSRSTAQLEGVLTELNSQAAEIGRIIGVINDIADQTNLLALNAAIEAARAGDAGRGFAVVADEVRKLAEKTMTATKEVESAVVQIQAGAKNCVDSMGKTTEQVEKSNQSSAEAVVSLREIMTSIEDISGRVAQIATAAEEQSASAEEINISTEEIASLIVKADEGASLAASATRNLAKLSRELLQLSQNFTTEEAA
ncbi:MAG: methyl-accepting chemotaxis protein [Desulfovibrionales bacterium]|nr:methyl-accepting chemotaxis protein [Desulfovibrionales bacterium]